MEFRSQQASIMMSVMLSTLLFSMKNKHLLATPFFLTGLALLLANDFIFKPSYGNAFTGKLSDFAGLFVLPIFLSAFSPKTLTLNCLASGLIFVFWNSPLAQPLIDYGHAMGIAFHRTVDPSDLLALAVLPFSYGYIRSFTQQKASALPLPVNLLAIISLFAFTATTLAPNTRAELNKRYESELTKKQILEELSELNCQWTVEPLDSEDSLYTVKNLIYQNDSLIRKATFTLTATESTTLIHLLKVETFDSYPTLFVWRQKRLLRKMTEKYLIEEIR